MDKSDRERDILSQIRAIFRYEILWNLRKKKVIAMFVIAIGLASIQLFLPTLLGSAENDPFFVLKNLNPPGFLIIALAVAVSMNSISGEFEEKTIEPLASKPISRKVIYAGKLLAIFVLLAILYSIMVLYFLGASWLVYGAQNGLNLSLLVFPIVVTLSTMVWVGISLSFGSLTKSSVTAAIGTIAIFFGIAIAGGIVTSFSPSSGPALNYLPGDGESGSIPQQVVGDSPVEGISVNTGTSSVGKHLLLYTNDSTAEVEVMEYKLNFDNISSGTNPLAEVGSHSYSMGTVLSRSFLVSIIYIVLFNVLGWFGLHKADVSKL